MPFIFMKNTDKIVEILLADGVGIIPTDTLYGLVGRAFSREAVERVYKLRKRNAKKPFIILISSPEDLALFGVKLDKKTEKILLKVWPGSVSVILPCPYEKFSYLHRGGKTLAFRLPQKAELIGLIKETGPLIAPSANPEGLPPSKTVEEAEKYFGVEVDFYFDGGTLDSPPSTLISVESGAILVKREGLVRF